MGIQCMHEDLTASVDGVWMPRAWVLDGWVISHMAALFSPAVIWARRRLMGTRSPQPKKISALRSGACGARLLKGGTPRLGRDDIAFFI